MTRRTLVTAALIAAVALSAAFGVHRASAAPYVPSPLPHGNTNISCTVHWFATVPYKHCSVIVQPGSVADADQRLARYGAHATGGAGAAAGALCAPAGPIAFVCAVIAAWKADVFVHAIQDAATERRCIQASWDTIPGISFPVSIGVVPYGSPPRWMYQYNTRTRDWDRYWGNPDVCQTAGIEPGLA